MPDQKPMTPIPEKLEKMLMTGQFDDLKAYIGEFFRAHDARMQTMEQSLSGGFAALPAWSQTFPKQSWGKAAPEEARYIGALSARAFGARHLIDWSGKHTEGVAGSVHSRNEKRRYNRIHHLRIKALRSAPGGCV